MSQLNLCWIDVNKSLRHLYIITIKFIASLETNKFVNLNCKKKFKNNILHNKLCNIKICFIDRHRNFHSLCKYSCLSFKVKEYILFHLSLNATHCLLIFDSSWGNIRSGTKQMDGSVQMYDLLHYDKYKISSLNYCACFYSFKNPMITSVLFLCEVKPTDTWYSPLCAE